MILGLVGLSMTSCGDFLTLYPLDKVVEENFWEDKNDLEGVRYGAYMQMAGTIEKFIAWGDARSDAYEYHTLNPDNSIYREILLANPDSTMDIFDWGAVYTTINYCNKVLAHGDEILENDPQFTPTDWQQMKAEVTALRALNYFYLIRAFKDIPFTFDVINSDEDVRTFKNTLQMDVLNTLIDDVKAVAGMGKSRFPNDADTKGLMTNTAIYALLAEMHLWRSALREGRLAVVSGEPVYTQEDVFADARSVIEYGQKALDALALQNQQITNSSYDRNTNKKDTYGSGLKNADLIKNEDMDGDYQQSSSNIEVSSFESIFERGNSEESMFEIQFSSSDRRSSGFFRTLWGYKTDNRFLLAVSNMAVDNALKNLTAGTVDSRRWYVCADGKYLNTEGINDLDDNAKYYYLTKWMRCTFDRRSVKDHVVTDIEDDISTTSYSNWIIYRMTDVMLMMAEAHAVLGTVEDLKQCRSIVDAIQKRSMLDQTTGLSKSTDNNKDACIKLVMNERLVELLGEGKRWFDLVRYAERIGGGTSPDPREPQFFNGADGVSQMVEEYLAKGAYSKLKSNMKSRMQNRYGLYCPIYYRERSANYYEIPQNPVWNREKGDNNNQSGS